VLGIASTERNRYLSQSTIDAAIEGRKCSNGRQKERERERLRKGERDRRGWGGVLVD